jgi:gluconolactonase
MKIELVCDKLEFPEGPIACSDGSVVITEIRGRRLSRIGPNGERTTIAETGGGPNGAAVGPDDAIWITNNGGAFEWVERNGSTFPGHTPPGHNGGCIQRFDLIDQSLRTVYDHCGKFPLLSPNDLVFDRSGGFWFTDMGSHNSAGHQHGGIYYAKTDGSHISRQRGHMLSPNGIGLSPDESVLYVADTLFARLWAFDILEPGVLAPPKHGIPGRVICNLQGYQMLDSLAVEEDGRVDVATIINGGISCIRTDGTLEHVPFPDPMCTNIAFGGPDMRSAWVTASSTGRLYKAYWPRAGLPTAFNL